MRAWLRDAGLWEAGQSHVFLDGGRAGIPAARHAEFWDAYARSLKAGETLRVVERVDPEAGFHMFMDVDVASPDDRAYAERLVCELLVPMASSLLGDGTSPSRVIVCGKRETCKHKPGLHVVWPGLVVDRDTALCVRDECVARIRATGFACREVGSFAPSRATGKACCEVGGFASSRATPGREREAWLSRALDASVYRGSGLRMIFSQKKPGDPADDVYVPVKEFEGGRWRDLALAEVMSELPRWLRDCSLRPVIGIQTKTKSKNRGAHAPHVADEAEGGPPNASLSFVPPAAYQPCRVTAARRVDGDSGAAFYRTSSRFCANVGRRHKSNHVYFVVTAGGAAYQRCHDPDCAGFSRRVDEGPHQMPCCYRMPAAAEVTARQLQRLLART